MRYVSLLVTRSSVIDSRDIGQSVITEAYRTNNRRYRFTFNTIAKKLNSYIREYGSISAVERVAEADYLIVFNLLEYRRSLGQSYPYGEIYVIINQKRESERAPRIVWKAKKVMWAEDAVKELIKSLKAVRGEK